MGENQAKLYIRITCKKLFQKYSCPASPDVDTYEIGNIKVFSQMIFSTV